MAYKVFISSVQREFAKEWRAIAAAIRKDRVLKLFFDPFLSLMNGKPSGRVNARFSASIVAKIRGADAAGEAV